MSGTPVLGTAPIVSHQTAVKNDSQAAVEDLMKQYESMKLDSGEPDERSFVWPEGKRPDIGHDQYNFELPVIDLAPVLNLQSLWKEMEQSEGEGNIRSGLEAEIEACEAAKSNVAKAIRAACEEHGFFQIINSGFPMEVVDQFRECCQNVFDLPLEEKMKIKEKPNPGKPSLPGYTGMKRNTAFTRLNPSHTWSEGLEYESPERTYIGRTEENANILWPNDSENSAKGRLLISSSEEYGLQSSRVIFLLLDLIVASLGIPEEAVNGLLGDRQKQQVTARMRVNHYPMCVHPELTWGLSCHTDPDVITLLYQDSVGGLQIRFKDGTWHGVQPRPDAFVVNCGDFMQAWTNGRFLSAEHRVVANEKCRRMSIAYFALSDIHHVISPRPECVDAEHPPRYRPFTRLEYVGQLMSLGLGNERGALLEKAFGIHS